MTKPIPSPGFSDEDGGCIPSKIKASPVMFVDEPSCRINGHLVQWCRLSSIAMDVAIVEMT